MKRNLNFIPSLLAVFLVAGLSAPSAWARMDRGKGPPSRGGMGLGAGPFRDGECRMVDELNLSADQIQKLREIREEGRREFDRRRGDSRDKMERVRAAHEKLNEALKGTASDKDLRKLFAELQAARNALVDSRFDESRFNEVLKIRAILTPEQRQKFRGLPMPGGGRGPGGGPTAGPGPLWGPPESPPPG